MQYIDKVILSIPDKYNFSIPNIDKLSICSIDKKMSIGHIDTLPKYICRQIVYIRYRQK